MKFKLLYEAPRLSGQVRYKLLRLLTMPLTLHGNDCLIISVQWRAVETSRDRDIEYHR